MSPSPFPGMDPYIEGPLFWPSVHGRLAVEGSHFVGDKLPARYYATFDDRVVVATWEDPGLRNYYPDLAIIDRKRPTRSHRGGTAIAAPVVQQTMFEEEMKESRIEIRTAGDEKLVTAIEFLSPANKTRGAEMRTAYLAKRREFLHSEANLIEVDLLRAGERPPFPVPLPEATYYVHLSRAERRPVGEIWPIRLADRLPPIQVPLVSPDPDIELDLQELFDFIYDRGQYARRIDYRRPPPAPDLPPEELDWVRSILSSKGLAG
ncbi:MAG: DUF4058 family protein [Planctomycetes bacterium]|nr:DUF4058 family protein [Planctomycetota bacterium]